ncbi:acyl-CoA dehydrogenase family protein [Frankia sp. CcI49]|uniref:acyl-CoA dehydrogenase family protein n=1 Tax=Frankia sp. CcI49 TaxID=1745382 RepID=UPI0009FD4490|nr:acyl-CoA dehydrogenase family protein [Frankia sp. CcI49]
MTASATLSGSASATSTLPPASTASQTLAAADDVLLTEDEIELRGRIREFAEAELVPGARAADQRHRLAPETLDQLRRMGLFGLVVSEEHGGGGATRVQLSLVVEEVARACASAAMTVMANAHSSGVISRYGTDDQRRRWLPAVATGESIAAVLLTEPAVGTDVLSMTTTARRRRATAGADDHYVLNGRKTFITNGDLAGTFVVFAKVRESDAPDGTVAAFVLAADSPGITVAPGFDKLGLRGSSTNEVAFDDVAVPAADCLGAEADGRRYLLEPLDGARLSTAAQAVGIGQRALDLARRYCLERHQSGRVIAHHQAVQLRLADMRIELFAARALLYSAARAVDTGRGSMGSAAAAKVFCTRTAAEITSRAVELVGGYGYIEEYEFARLLRDAKGGEIYDGTNDVNRLLLARQLVREGTPC